MLKSINKIRFSRKGAKEQSESEERGMKSEICTNQQYFSVSIQFDVL
jgi:hypothetical protein